MSLQNACQIFINCTFDHVWQRFFKFMMFAFLENALNLGIFTHALVPYSKLQAELFKNLFQKEMEKTVTCFIKIQSENMKMTRNIRLFIFCRIFNFSKCNDFTALQIGSII